MTEYRFCFQNMSWSACFVNAFLSNSTPGTLCSNLTTQICQEDMIIRAAQAFVLYVIPALTIIIYYPISPPADDSDPCYHKKPDVNKKQVLHKKRNPKKIVE